MNILLKYELNILLKQEYIDVVWKIALLLLAYIDLVSINHLVFQADVIVIFHVHFWTSIAILDAFYILSLP
jgi:hypothetical protein